MSSSLLYFISCSLYDTTEEKEEEDSSDEEESDEDEDGILGLILMPF